MLLVLYVEVACAAWMIPVLCSCACVLCLQRKLKEFPNVDSGVLRRRNF